MRMKALSELSEQILADLAPGSCQVSLQFIEGLEKLEVAKL
jgi:hypothetical protein